MSSSSLTPRRARTHHHYFLTLTISITWFATLHAANKKEVNDIDNKPEILDNDTISIDETFDSESNPTVILQETLTEKIV